MQAPKVSSNLIKCVKIRQDGTMHIHADCFSQFTGKRFTKYFLQSTSTFYAADRITDEDVAYKTVKIWNFQKEQLVRDVAFLLSPLRDIFNHSLLGQRGVIAFDATSGLTDGSGTSQTLAHTCTGSNLILFDYPMDAGDSNGGDFLTDCKYAGVADTAINNSTITNNSRVYLRYLLAPATGANNIVSTWSQTISSLALGGSSYTGAKQSAQPDSSNTGTASTAASLTLTTTVVAANCWLTGWFRNDTFGGLVWGTGTERGTGGAKTKGDSNATVGTGAQTLQVNTNGQGNANWCGCIASFAPAVAATVGMSTLPLLGIG